MEQEEPCLVVYEPEIVRSASLRSNGTSEEVQIPTAKQIFDGTEKEEPTSHKTALRGVLVQEVDEGQPCLSCNEKCSGFSPHMWKTMCTNCKCPREAHDVYHEEFVNVCDRIGFQPSPDHRRQAPTKEKTLSAGYSWVPPGLCTEKIEEYFNHLPEHKVPRLGTAGEKYRDRQLILQLPKQDLALAYCKFIAEGFESNFESFVNNRNELALDIGYVKEKLEKESECGKCHELMFDEVAVIAPKLGEDVIFHPTCFVCSVCEELLVDLTYCVRKDKLFCERHYAEELKPRCSACDEVSNLVHIKCSLMFL